MKKINILIVFFSFFLFSSAQVAENLSVKGVVLDDGGDPLIGVMVQIKERKTIGVVTDVDGKFELNVNKGERITISFMGFRAQEILINKVENNLTIRLETESTELTEAVVTGLGSTQRRISISGAVTSVDPGQLQTPSTSLSNMLGGRVAGILSTQNSGEPGQNIAEFWVRGIGTFGASGGALILIDGLEGKLNDIDPADIESFSVLKDASATAVYGVRGADGVVLITTKRGQSGKLQIQTRFSVSAKRLNTLPEYVGAYEYAQLANEANMVRGNVPVYNRTDLDIIKLGHDPDIFPDVNWIDELIKRTSWQQNAYISARGGGEVARYFLSLATTSESAAYNIDKHAKYTSGIGNYSTHRLRANIDMNVTKSTIVYFGVDAGLKIKGDPGSAYGTNNGTDWIWDAQSSLNPMALPVRYSNGAYPGMKNSAEKEKDFDNRVSPYVLLNNTGKQTRDDFDAKFTIELRQDFDFLLKGLKARLQGAYNKENMFREVRYVRPALYAAKGRDVDGNLIMGAPTYLAQSTNYLSSESQYRRYHLESTIDYSGIFGDHRVGALLYYYMNDSKLSTDFSANGLLAIPKRYQGLSSRVSYSFRDTYFIDVNAGYTGSENFKKGEQFGLFPSVSGSWVPTSYEYVREIAPWLSFLKFRGSYGIVGQDKLSGLSRFAYQTIIESTGAGWGSKTGGLIEKQIGADNLKWEKSKKMDIGMEVKFLKDNLSFTVDYFTDKRDGIYQKRVQIPDYVGLITMPYGNVGKMKSYGADGNVEFIHSINQDMGFIVRGNFSIARNRVDNWEEAYNPYDYQSRIGKPLDYQKGLISLGYFKDEEDVTNSPKPSDWGVILPGDIKYKDVNGDGVINDDDMVPISFQRMFPRLMYGFGGEFTYKNWSLSMLFKGTGNTTYFRAGVGNDIGYIPFANKEIGNVLTYAADPKNRWIPMDYALANGIDPSLAENPNAKYPRMSYGANVNNSKASTHWMGNAKYLRLEELNIGYTFRPKDIPALSKVGITSATLQFVANNLFTIDNVELWDAQQAESNGRKYPIPTTFTLQASIYF